jgi:hypothetical protein
MRLDHGPQRLLLQVPELRLNERLQLTATPDSAASESDMTNQDDAGQSSRSPARVGEESY